MVQRYPNVHYICIANYNIMLEQVVSIVRQAAGYMVTDGFRIEQKDGAANIVTSSDYAVQHYLCKELAKLIPGSGFICEEEDYLDPDKELVWIIDPIDGTCNYARGIDDCCISVALKKGSDIILGTVFCPSRNEMYCAELGKGAFLNGKPIHVSDRPFENALFITALGVYVKQCAEYSNSIIMEVYPQVNDIRRFGSAALDLCYIAAGRCEIMFEVRLCPWDYAAGMLILTEAGGCVSGLKGKPMTFDRPEPIIAANCRKSHTRLLETVDRHIASIPY